MLQFFNYGNNPVSFRKENDKVYVNATEMAKPFGKRPVDWLKTQSALDYINAFSEVKKITSLDLVQVTHGNNGGTWMFEDIALEYSRSLAPEFSIWCNDRVKEVITTGVSTLTDDDAMIAHAMNVLQKRLETKQVQLNLANETIQIQAPKVEYFDEVLQSGTDITTTVIAGELGMSGKALNKLLHEHKIQYKVDGVWKLYAKYEGLGYTTSRTHPRKDQYGHTKTEILTTWTEKGRLFIHDFVKSLKKSA